MKCSYLVSFLTVVPINGHPLERPVCLSVHGNPWKTLVKKILSSWLSLSQTPPTECLFIKECALTLNQVLRWRPWLSVKILSFFGPVWLILYLHRGLGQRVHVNGFRFNIRVFEYLCIKSLQVWYFLFHRPNLAHSKDYCMKYVLLNQVSRSKVKVKAKSFKMAFILLFFTNEEHFKMVTIPMMLVWYGILC